MRTSAGRLTPSELPDQAAKPGSPLVPSPLALPQPQGAGGSPRGSGSQGSAVLPGIWCLTGPVPLPGGSDKVHVFGCVTAESCPLLKGVTQEKPTGTSGEPSPPRKKIEII